MKIDAKAPPRKYLCGLLDAVTIADLGTITLECGDVFNIENSFSLLSLKCYSWGYEISIKPKCSGSILISGTSWQTSHLMFRARKKAKQFEEYSQSEKHYLFFNFDVDKVAVQAAPEIYQVSLKDDQQYTFCVDGEHDLDITSKSWGFYLTPSLFNRCKKFELNPFLIKSDEISRVLMVFSNHEQSFRQSYDVPDSDKLYLIDEESGICDFNVKV